MPGHCAHYFKHQNITYTLSIQSINQPLSRSLRGHSYPINISYQKKNPYCILSTKTEHKHAIPSCLPTNPILSEVVALMLKISVEQPNTDAIFLFI